MPDFPTTFVGVDPTSGRFPFTFAAIDQDRKLIAMSAGDSDDVLVFLSQYSAVTVAINAPPRPNRGLVRKELERRNVPPGQLRGSDLRQAECDLRERGISILPTPSRPEACPAWMQLGFSLYRLLEEVGFMQYPSDQATLQYLETHPYAAYCALLGQLPLPKPSLEGRLQRQIVLYEKGLGIKDPMGFFEEITRHKLMHGILPVEYVYATEELDTLVAAYSAYCAIHNPQEMIFIGDSQEGQIALPVGGLQERYN
jgi:predicted nuclease with RNAse H fold